MARKFPPLASAPMGLSGLPMAKYVEADEERFKGALDRAYVRAPDRLTGTAQMFNQLDSEDLIGKWFRRTGKRDEIFLATKFGANYWLPDGTRSVKSDPPNM